MAIKFKDLAGPFAAVTLAAMPLAAPAQADDTARVIPANASSAYNFVTDSGDAAYDWSTSHPDGVALSISIGAQSSAKPEKIVQYVGEGLDGVGITNKEFFFEQGEGDSTIITLSYRGRLLNTLKNYDGTFDLTNGPRGIMGSFADIAHELEVRSSHPSMYSSSISR